MVTTGEIQTRIGGLEAWMVNVAFAELERLNSYLTRKAFDGEVVKAHKTLNVQEIIIEKVENENDDTDFSTMCILTTYSNLSLHVWNVDESPKFSYFIDWEDVGVPGDLADRIVWND